MVTEEVNHSEGYSFSLGTCDSGQYVDHDQDQ